ncbi:hypothetical protein CC78DRAFT_578273 [Lojkania enalia]|uniref:Uncharacterized protein n=1 Tax=Lojkania enalia TaxID=147567 RepID=A0A9P4N4W2_9PLEO|nr:hypothetical protein CC78DRAFT_578273 [Didymosphaeria enalia]
MNLVAIYLTPLYPRQRQDTPLEEFPRASKCPLHPSRHVFGVVWAPRWRDSSDEASARPYHSPSALTLHVVLRTPNKLKTISEPLKTIFDGFLGGSYCPVPSRLPGPMHNWIIHRAFAEVIGWDNCRSAHGEIRPHMASGCAIKMHKISPVLYSFRLSALLHIILPALATFNSN